MIFSELYPQKKLLDYIQFFRIRHFIIPPNIKPHPKPFPPHPEQCITFYPRGTEIMEVDGTNVKRKRARSIISGQYTHRINRSSLYDEIIIIVVVFRPGALYKLTGIPFNELINQDLDLELVFPREGRIVNDLLSSSSDYNEMIQIIEEFLLNRIQKIKIEPRAFDIIFGKMLLEDKKYSIDWLAGQACLSSRQFERKADLYLGVSPKLLQRISRFNQTYLKKTKNYNLDWLSIAVSCGYYDYQHLVKDYKEFVNNTPKLFFDEESNSLDRALGLNK